MKRVIRRFVRHMENTWRNKLMAMFFIVLGLISDILLEDGSFFIFALALGLFLMVEKRDVFEDWA